MEEFSKEVKDLTNKQDKVHDSRMVLSLSINDLRTKSDHLIGNATQIKRSNVHGKLYTYTLNYQTLIK